METETVRFVQTIGNAVTTLIDCVGELAWELARLKGDPAIVLSIATKLEAFSLTEEEFTSEEGTDA